MEGNDWHYDTYHIIYNLRVAIGFSPYIHHAGLEKKRLANKESWVEFQVVLQDQLILLSMKQEVKREPFN
jgi:hypothetical protein